ncbi:LysR family transcriptional regulator [Pseudactinotalea suaedae]
MTLMTQVRAIQVLTELGREGSFSGAAQAVGITQSAASQHIAALEGHVGTILVDRGVRPLELTEAGAVLARHGAAILTHLDDAQQSLDEIVGRQAGRLRIGSFPTALTSFVPQVLSRLRAVSPDLELTVVDDHMPALLPRLESGELDMAVVYEAAGTPSAITHRLTVVPLFEDPYRALLPVRHRLARTDRRLRLADLKDEPWVGGRPGSAWYRILLAACRADGFEPRALLSTDDHRAVQAFVAAGLGIGVVPGLAAAQAPAGVTVRDLHPGGPVRRIGVAHRSGGPVPAPIRTAVALLQQVTAGR